MWTRFLHASIVTAIAGILLTGCDTTQTGTTQTTTQKKSASAMPYGARQTGTNMR